MYRFAVKKLLTHS